MIPIKDYNPTTRPAVIVPILIALNIVVFLFVQPTFKGGSRAEREEKQLEFLVCRASIPYEVTHRENLANAPEQALDRTGRAFSDFERARCPRKHVFWSIVLSMFLHGGFLHIAGNMLFLWVFGNNIEDRLGKLKFAIFYLLCGFAATLAQSYVHRNDIVPMIGASGAIAGVLGAYLLLYPRAVVRNLVFFIFITVIDLPAVVVLGLWFVLQVFQGVGDTTAGSGVAYMAHVGGFVAGLALIYPFRPRPPAARGSMNYPIDI